MGAHHLTEQAVGRYRSQGYLVPEWRLSEPRVQRLRAALERLLLNNPGVRPEKLVSAHLAGHGGAANAEGVHGDEEFMLLARDPQILDMVEALIGPDIVLWGCHVFCKPAGDGHETPWHQDGHYWPIRPLANCTVWVALDDSLADNGCLRVIPGSQAEQVTHQHLQEDRADVALNQRMADHTFDESQAVDVELRAGQMSMHDVFMIHGARPNRSARRRAGVALRYMPATSVFRRDLNPVDGQSGVPVAFATRPLWLLRGVDRSGRNDFQVGFD